MTLKVLADYGLKGVFFVESLFASRFGVAPLAEIVDLISRSDQEIQLHAHPEWADEAVEPILPHRHVKTPLLRTFSASDQLLLISRARDLLIRGGAKGLTAFRSGSFSMNLDTIGAAADANFRYDLSYNSALASLHDIPVPRGGTLQPFRFGGVIEYPMTVYKDASGRVRHLQLGASSFEEMESVLWHAHEHGWDSVVMLSHNFELLNQAKDRPDEIVHSRFLRLCKMLDRHRDCFETTSFIPGPASVPPMGATLPVTPLLATGRRYVEQLWRRTYR
jgi:hypothetical protein